MASQPTSIRTTKQYLFLGGMLILGITIITASLLSAYLWLPASIHYHIVERHTINSPDERAGHQVGIIIPKAGPYQSVKDVKVKWPGEVDKLPSAYVDIYHFSIETEVSQTVEARIEYDVVLPQGKVTWDAPVSKSHFLPANGIESEHPLIAETASQLSNNPYQIYSYLSKQLVYSEENCQKTNISALEALHSGTCACIGYARLMVALYRAAGIPAQMIIGTILPDDYFALPQISSATFPGHGHAWVEYHDLDRWSLIDPSWGRGFSTHLEFNRNDGRHLSYGEYDHFMQAHGELYHWVSKRPFIVDSRLTYLISSDSDATTSESEIKVTKSWDGRWLNAIIVLAVITYGLCRIRDRIFFPERN